MRILRGPSAISKTLLLSGTVLVACESSDPQVESDGASSDAESRIDADASCRRSLGPANRERFVVVSRPYGDGGAQANQWEVLSLSESGELSSSGNFFSMGRATTGTVVFTPDGEMGFVAQNDGSIGVFRIDASGEVTVVHQAWDSGHYASSLRMSADGKTLIVLDGNWRNNGGGVYRVSIDCQDGSVVDLGLGSASKLPREAERMDSGAMLIAAIDLGNSPMDQDLHLSIDGDLNAPSASVRVFPDRDAIVGSMAITSDEKFVLLGDTSEFSGVDTRIGIARIGATSLDPIQVLTPIPDPFAIATSPYNDAALVVSGFDNAIYKLSYDPKSATMPFTNLGELSYQGGAPALPGNLVQIDRGDLRGLVIITENQGLRRVRFDGKGAVVDLGRTEFGESYAGIVGALGIQP